MLVISIDDEELKSNCYCCSLAFVEGPGHAFGFVIGYNNKDNEQQQRTDVKYLCKDCYLKITSSIDALKRAIKFRVGGEV